MDSSQLTWENLKVKETLDTQPVLCFIPYEADLKYGNCMVDAKSILGVLGMAIRKKATLTIYGEGPQNDICEKLQKYAIA